MPVAHRRPARPLRAQPLVDAGHGLEPMRVVVGDEPCGGIEDGLGGAVVLHQDHLARPRVEPAEAQEVGGGGAAPAIDGLVVVAHHREVGGFPRHEPQHLELGLVRVLELVHEDVAVALAQAAEDGRALAQQHERAMDLVAEVHEPRLGQQALLGLVERRELELLLGLVHLGLAAGRRPRRLGEGAVLRGRDVLVLGPAGEGDEGPEVARGIAEGPEAAQGQLEDPLAQEHDLLGLAQHAEVGMQAGLEAPSRRMRSPKAWKVEMHVSA